MINTQVLLGCITVIILITPKVGFAQLETPKAADRTGLVGRKPCTVRSGQDNRRVVIGHLVTGEERSSLGAIVISGGKIVDIGSEDDIMSREGDPTIIDCRDAYVSPGLINPHEHANFGGFPDKDLNPEYSHRDEWQGKLGTDYVKLDYPSVNNRNIHIFWIELRHLLAGTTLIAGSGAMNGLVKNVASQRAKKYVYKADVETFPYEKEDDDGNSISTTQVFRDANLSCPFTGNADISPNTNERLMDTAYVPHIAEGTNCTAELEAELYLAYVKSQRDKGDTRRYSMIHGLGMNKASVEKAGMLKLGLIWSPRSNVALYGTTVDIPSVMDVGVTVALGTDWSYSGSYNMLEELSCAERIADALWPEELSEMDYWRMATEDGAEALGLKDTTGKLEVGLAADLMVFRKSTDDPYRDLLDAEVSDIIATIVDGRLVSGYGPWFDIDTLPNGWHCDNELDDHFLCFNYRPLFSFSHREMIDRNSELVPLFSVDRQAMCSIPNSEK